MEGQVGAYEILSLIGEGGMGQVYRAKDKRLGREVAVKVLPPEYARDADRLRRFELEARAVASLSHPNILAIHDFGKEGETCYVVMELLQGMNFRRVLEQGPLPVRKVIDYASQVARGLATAHEKGVIHRDLKPENLFLTRDGQVKILDFGLAKLQPTAEDSSDPTLSTVPMKTDAGSLLGTVGYVSPEQVRRESVDHRSDIFVFGAVLHELLTGRRAFLKESAIETLNAILNEEPPVPERESGSVPPGLVRILRHCLEKNPAERFQSARDLAFHLESLSFPSGDETQPIHYAPGRAAGRRRWRVPALIILSVLVILAALWVTRSFHSGAQAPTRHLDVVVPARAPIGDIFSKRCFCLSPDGRHLVYTSDRGEQAALFTYSFGSGETLALRGTEGGISPAFSPDGKWVAFATSGEGRLQKVPAEGGAPVTLAQAEGPGTVVWSPDGRLYFSTLFGAFGAPFGTPHWVGPDGGEVHSFCSPDPARGERRVDVSGILPGGDRLLLSVSRLDGGSNIDLYSTKDGSRRTLIPNGHGARWISTGHLLYTPSGHSRTVMAVPFDPDRPEIAGSPRGILDGVAWGTQYDVSSDGTLVYLPADAETSRNALVLRDRTGMERRLLEADGVMNLPRFSPDGNRIVLGKSETEVLAVRLWVYELGRQAFSRLFSETPGTSRIILENCPVWSPGGDRLAFLLQRMDLSYTLMTASSSGGESTLLAKLQNGDEPGDWSPDGAWIVFARPDRTLDSPATDIWLLPLENPSSCAPFMRTPYNEGGARVSPDGRWLAYFSDESGEFEVYVQSFPKPSQKQKISRDGGGYPIWSRDGRELFFRTADGVYAVPVTTGETFKAGPPELLFKVKPVLSSDEFWWDVGPDNRGFVMVQDIKPPLTHFRVTLDWFEELRRKIPVK